MKINLYGILPNQKVVGSYNYMHGVTISVNEFLWNHTELYEIGRDVMKKHEYMYT